VVVKVTTSEGLVGFGEARHGPAPAAIAQLINTTIRQLLLEPDALEEGIERHRHGFRGVVAPLGFFEKPLLLRMWVQLAGVLGCV
jgi:L-alanine-DL-glutamate epimerase-like enolase superfamily enzyme